MTTRSVMNTIVGLIPSVLITGSAFCQDLTLVKGRVSEPLDGAVIVIEGCPVDGDADHDTVWVEQKHMRFVPPITAVVEGTTVAFPNSEDVIYHNVLIFSDDPAAEDRPVNLGTYRTGESRSIVAKATGAIDVLCVIHSRMYALIVVTDSPCYSTADQDGRYEIRGVPPGSYDISCWSVDVEGQKFRKETRNVAIPARGTAVIDF